MNLILRNNKMQEILKRLLKKLERIGFNHADCLLFDKTPFLHTVLYRQYQPRINEMNNEADQEAGRAQAAGGAYDQSNS